MIWELRHEHKIGLLIDVAGIPRSTYYYYRKQFNEPKPDKYAEIKLLIRKIYDDNKGRYGYRRCELTSKTSKAGKAELSRENACKVRKSAVYSRISGGIK